MERRWREESRGSEARLVREMSCWRMMVVSRMPSLEGEELEDEKTRGGVKKVGDGGRECGSEVEEGRVRHRGRAGAPTTRGEVFAGVGAGER